MTSITASTDRLPDRPILVAQKVVIWCGPLGAAMVGCGFFAAGFVPPPSPTESAETIAQLFTDDGTRIRIGSILIMIGTVFLGPFFAALTVQMKRMEGVWSALAYTQLALGALAVFEFILPPDLLAGRDVPAGA